MSTKATKNIKGRKSRVWLKKEFLKNQKDMAISSNELVTIKMSMLIVTSGKKTLMGIVLMQNDEKYSRNQTWKFMKKKRFEMAA